MKKKLIILSSFVSVLSLSPVVAFAVDVDCTVGKETGELFNLYAIFCRIGQIFGAVLPVMIALAGVLFVWGVVMYVVGDEEAAKKKGRDRMIYGIIGLAIIIGLWGLVIAVANTFGFGTVTGEVTIPRFDY